MTINRFSLIKTIALLALLSATSAPLALAADKTLKGKALTKATQKQSDVLPDVTGEVQNVDPGANVIEVKADSSYTRIVKVDSTTQVLIGTKTVRVADVSEGDTVTLHSTSLR